MVSRTERAIALRRIRRLFQLALEVAKQDLALADRYVEIARRIAMRARIRMPREYKRLICKGCKRLLLPGLTCRVRLQPRREPHVAITCLRCGHVFRMPIKGRKDRERLMAEKEARATRRARGRWLSRRGPKAP
ncbi:MAG TPA: ribonuclease P [Candidatus Bathyarchaeota archaeon]|nr:ribonuclease P [Candidatus Bathyarchaeota archaeon]